MTVLEKFQNGDQSALARIITYIEDRKEGYRDILSKIYANTGKAVKIGFTGPPGAGKSSLVNNICKWLASKGKTVAVIAVDPSSPFTGGALLGDRIRLTDLPTDGSIYIRSMATRGSTGGLAAATGSIITVLDAFGFDYVLVETVGVGQIELDIVDACDTVIVVLVPESGDSIQTLKAGLMEIADIFAVNKADRPGSDILISELDATIGIKRDKSEWELPIVATEAINNKNTDQLLDMIEKHINYSKKSGRFERHRKKQIKKKILKILQFHVNNLIHDKLTGIIDLDQIALDIYQGKTDPHTACREIIRLSRLD